MDEATGAGVLVATLGTGVGDFAVGVAVGEAHARLDTPDGERGTGVGLQETAPVGTTVGVPV